MKKKKVVIICGGGSTEHDISILSAKYIAEQLASDKELIVSSKEIKKNDMIPGHLSQFDFVIPCLHGYPGETGDFASLLEMMEIPFLGAKSEAHRLCFNKVSTKLWLDALEIPNTPFLFMSKKEELNLADKALEQWGEVYIKASSQGSSIGCSPARNKTELYDRITDAFTHSPYVLLEQKITGRELEVACYAYDNDLIFTTPGEIVPPDSFYSYEEKYSKNSQTTLHTQAKDLSAKVQKEIKKHAQKAFVSLKLRHLARVDFFVDDKEKVFLNEINTFPGMTAISLFPRMLQNQGHSFSHFLSSIIKKGEK
ncbi:MAG: D-alanine--D-alanine ligase [Halobacteriovoraceae bacterium]|nr:D-alanine--D-alanine ligase [Halobacteriovoraceae bacterium]